MNNAVPTRKYGHSSMIARLGENLCLATATARVTALVKEKDMLHKPNDAKSSHVYTKALPAEEALLQSIQTMGYVYTENFQNQHEKHQRQRGVDLDESDNLFLFDPLYDNLRKQNLQDSDLDGLKAKDMNAFCDLHNML